MSRSLAFESCMEPPSNVSNRISPSGTLATLVSSFGGGPLGVMSVGRGRDSLAWVEDGGALAALGSSESASCAAGLGSDVPWEHAKARSGSAATMYPPLERSSFQDALSPKGGARVSATGLVSMHVRCTGSELGVLLPESRVFGGDAGRRVSV